MRGMAARRALSRLKKAAQSPDTTNGSIRCRAAASSLLLTQVGKKVQGESPSGKEIRVLRRRHVFNPASVVSHKYAYESAGAFWLSARRADE